jgi:hypothetical protein
MEHALAEERTAEGDPIEPPDEVASVIDLDGMAVAAGEQRAIQIADAGIDPGAAAARSRLGGKPSSGMIPRRSGSIQ